MACSRELFRNGTAKNSEFSTLITKSDTPTVTKNNAQNFRLNFEHEKSRNLSLTFQCNHRPVNATYPPEVLSRSNEDDFLDLEIDWRTAVACKNNDPNFKHNRSLDSQNKIHLTPRLSGIEILSKTTLIFQN